MLVCARSPENSIAGIDCGRVWRRPENSRTTGFDCPSSLYYTNEDHIVPSPKSRVFLNAHIPSPKDLFATPQTPVRDGSFDSAAAAGYNTYSKKGLPIWSS